MSVISMQPFFPRLVLENPEQRVFPAQGAVLHVRLAGSSALVVTHERDGKAGAQALGRLFSEVFEQLLECIARFGGDVLDLNAREIVALFPDQSHPPRSVERCVAAALAMRAVMDNGEGEKDAARPFGLTISCAISCGAIHGMLLGEEEYGHRVVFTGQALEEAYRASLQAGAGKVTLNPSAGVRLDPKRVRTSPPLPTPVMARVEALLDDVNASPREELEIKKSDFPLHLSPVLSTVLREGGPPPIFCRVASLTAEVVGFDPETAGSLEPLLTWYAKVQEHVKLHEGQITAVRVGKHTKLEAIFGAPFSHIDEETRALRCALGLQRTARDMPEVSEQSEGVATGCAYVGLVGAPWRMSYSALSERIELSHSLAEFAGPWEVVVDRHTVSRAGFGFDWGPPPSVPHGGNLELVTARVLYGEGAHGTKLTSRARGGLVGRENLMAELAELADAALAGKGTLVSLVGRAGIGKSALLLWLGQLLQEGRRIPVYRGECNAIVRHAPYHSWMPVFRDWLDLQSHLPAEDQIQRIRQRIASLGEDLLPRLPLLGMVTGLTISDTPMTSGLNARKRREALHTYILEILRRAHASAPMGIILEDVHWADDASLELLRHLVRNMGAIPLFITATRRPEEAQSRIVETLEALEATRTIQISELDSDALVALACRHIGAKTLSSPLNQLLLSRAGGSPLFLEELTLYLRDTDQIKVDYEAVATLHPSKKASIPYSIHDVILGRVAQLDEGAQLTLKAASVIGRTFGLGLLQEIYPVPFELDILVARLERMEGLDIVRRDDVPGQVWAVADGRDGKGKRGTAKPDRLFFFKHALICDTVYNTLTAPTRRNLHEAVGSALEQRLTADNRSELVLSIAEHFRRTLRMDKQRIYFREAGEIAKSRALYKEAYNYFHSAENLSSLAGDRDSVADLLDSENYVLNLLGERELQRETIGRWKEIVQESRDERRFGDALRAEGNLLSRVGQASQALKILQQAQEIARALKEPVREAKALRAICRTYYQLGDFKRAVDSAEAALKLIAGRGDWKDEVSDLVNIGVLLSHQFQFDEGRKRLDKALEMAQGHSDLHTSAIIFSNLADLEVRQGRYDEAIGLYDGALRLKKQVGDRQEEVATLANLAFAYLSVGSLKECRENCEAALRLAPQLESSLLESHGLSTLGMCYFEEGKYGMSRSCLTKAIAICQKRGGRAIQLESLEWLAKLELFVGRPDAATKALEQAFSFEGAATPQLVALSALCKSRRGLQAHAEVQAETVAAELSTFSLGKPPTHLANYFLALVYRSVDPDDAFKRVDAARSELLKRVNSIGELELREQALERIVENRLILATWDAWRAGEAAPPFAPEKSAQ